MRAVFPAAQGGRRNGGCMAVRPLFPYLFLMIGVLPSREIENYYCARERPSPGLSLPWFI